MNISRKERRKQERLARKARTSTPASDVEPTPKSPKSPLKWVILTILLVGGLGTAWLMSIPRTVQGRMDPATIKLEVVKVDQKAEAPRLTLEKLLEKSPAELDAMDIAEMNLLCAQGLPPGDTIDIPISLATLDHWAKIVEREIARNQHRFRENPAEYNHSEGVFKTAMMLMTLQQDLRVHYDPAMMGPYVNAPDLEARRRDMADEGYFKDSRSVFLHGILSNDRSGTCASMPVLYVAIGRRLGFPLKLVGAKGHLFIRWEGQGERFNMEGTNGVDTLPDAYYKNWPLPISDEEIASGEYLKSLTPQEELAIFMGSRATCLRSNGDYALALVAAAQANRLWPGMSNTQIGLAKTAEIVTSPLGPARPPLNNYEQAPSPNFPAEPPPLTHPDTIFRFNQPQSGNLPSQKAPFPAIFPRQPLNGTPSSETAPQHP